MKKKNTKKENEERNVSDAEVKTSRPKKNVKLKQYFVIAESVSGDRKYAFFINTCGLKAREAFTQKFGDDFEILQVTQPAVSEKTSDWLESNTSFQFEL